MARKQLLVELKKKVEVVDDQDLAEEGPMVADHTVKGKHLEIDLPALVGSPTVKENHMETDLLMEIGSQ